MLCLTFALNTFVGGIFLCFEFVIQVICASEAMYIGFVAYYLILYLSYLEDSLAQMNLTVIWRNEANTYFFYYINAILMGSSNNMT